MAHVPAQIRIAELDYDQILANLIEFMKADPAFADYDFAGSGLRLLARVLAYTTLYNNIYLTNAVNESFLDTAQLRSSVASHARMLGYDMQGTRSASLFANVQVTLSDNTAPSITLPRLTQFALTSNTQYTFYNTADVLLTKNSSTSLYEGSSVALLEGRPLAYQFTVDLTNPTQRFIIPNANIDFGSIAVRVQASSVSNVQTTFTLANNYLTIDGDDPVFFVQESYKEFAELKFGNGTVGQALEHGNIILVDYFVSRGEEGNNLRGPFRADTANVADFVRAVTTADGNTSPSSGGADPESLDTARFLAPLTYAAQNRCVTAEDYKAIILRDYGEHIAAINVFGGEEGDPNDPRERPVFGRVFIVVKPNIGLQLTETIRELIEETIVRPHSVVGVIPEVIDPDYTYLVINGFVKYDRQAASKTRLELETEVKAAVTAFATNSVEKFDTAFKFSRLQRAIDDTDESFSSSLVRIDLEKRLTPELQKSNQFTLKFNCALRQNGNSSVVLESLTNRFRYLLSDGTTQNNCFFHEQTGKLNIAYRNSNNVITNVKTNIGTVDKTTGLVTISDFVPENIENDETDVRFRIVPAINDFAPRLNQLYTLDSDELNIIVRDVATATLDDITNFFSGGILP